jgi:hypothetical protein
LVHKYRREFWNFGSRMLVQPFFAMVSPDLLPFRWH